MHTLPPVGCCPKDVGGLVVALVGGRGAQVVVGAGAVGGTKRAYVSRSHANTTTSDHVYVVPCNVTLVFLTNSKSCYME